MGEKLDEFEPFHPERMASRILGMGDVVSLVERAAEAVSEDEAKRMEEKMRKGEFTLEDFLEQLRAMKKLGSLESIVKMLPGGGDALKQMDIGKQEKEFKRMEGMVCAMTKKERLNPDDSQRQPPPPHRRRQRRDGDGVEHDAEQVFPDADDDEKNGQDVQDDGQNGRRGCRGCSGGETLLNHDLP